MPVGNQSVSVQKDLPPHHEQTDEEIIEDAKRYLDLVNRADGDNIKEGLIDLEYLVGNHWPDKQKRQRELDGRPALTVNKLPTYHNLVTNDMRQNRATIKVSPVGSNADRYTAEVLQGMIKHIEYDSSAEIATDTAAASAAAIGFGYFRIVPEYCDEESFCQKLSYKRIRNAFTVAFDPSSEAPDGSDQQRCLIHIKMDKDAFKLEYPDANPGSDGLVIGNASVSAGATLWLSDQFVRVAEFYRIEREPVHLVQMSDGGVMLESEVPAMLPDHITVVRRRSAYRKKVMWYKLTALEILERTEIMCKWIPVFPVFGAEIDLDGKVVRKGLIRDARDPQLMYDYWMTSATEEVAMRTKTPFIGAEGQFEGHENEWNQANNRSYPFLEYKPVSVDGQIAPPPQRNPMADIPNGMLTMAMHANDNIKATTGLFDSSLGAAGNAQSGKQEIAQQRQGNISNFHYQDGLTRTIRHAGRCIIDMIPHYYDTERVVQVMREDGKIESTPVNQPLGPEQQAQINQQRQQEAQVTGTTMQAIGTVLHDLTVGEYAVVVDTGPSYSTMRKEAADAMVQFGQSWPKLMDIAGDKVVKAMDWPGADEISQRIERTIPANIRFDPKDANAGPPPLPPEVQQQMQQMQQTIQELQGENQRLTSGVDRENIKASSAEKIAQLQGNVQAMIAQANNETKRDVEEIKGWINILIQHMQPPPALTSEVTSDMTDDNTAGA